LGEWDKATRLTTDLAHEVQSPKKHKHITNTIFIQSNEGK